MMTENLTHYHHFNVYKQRWLVLFSFSFCCMIDNIICFTFAPVNKNCYELYGYSNNIFPQVYLLTYAICSIPLSFLFNDFNIRTNVTISSLLQFTGCFIRYLFWNNLKFVMIGQFVSSLGQVAFVNGPTEVSIIWFPVNERIISTSVSIISNIFGIALIYLYAPFIVIEKNDIQFLLFSTCFVSFIGFLLIFIFFENNPDNFIGNKTLLFHSDTSETIIKEEIKDFYTDDYIDIMKYSNKINRTRLCKYRSEDFSIEFLKNENENDFYVQINDIIKEKEKKKKNKVKKFWKEFQFFLSKLKIQLKCILRKKDIIKLIIVFSYSECLVTGFSTDISLVLKDNSLNKGYFIITEFLFILNVIIGSIIICFNSKIIHFKNIIIFCIFMIIIVSFSLQFISHIFLKILLLSSIGFWCGPIQPLSVEMASVIVYPLSANLCTCIIQVISFIISAIFISFLSFVCLFVNVNIPLMIISFLILLISLNIDQITTYKNYTLTLISVRSGLINRHTLDTNIKDFSLNEDGYIKESYLLDNEKLLSNKSNKWSNINSCNFFSLLQYFSHYFSSSYTTPISNSSSLKTLINNTIDKKKNIENENKKYKKKKYKNNKYKNKEYKNNKYKNKEYKKKLYNKSEKLSNTELNKKIKKLNLIKEFILYDKISDDIDINKKKNSYKNFYDDYNINSKYKFFKKQYFLNYKSC